MTDHRRIQRALFRMQLDAGFARAVHAGDEAALASTGLASADLTLVTELDPAAVAADKDGTRRRQVLGNAASEYALTVAQAERFAASPGLLADFACAPELHCAIQADERLPLAFGSYARRRAAESGDVALIALAELESVMAHARRTPFSAPAPGPGEIARTPRAHLAEFPAGTLGHAAALRAHLDSGAPDAHAPRPAIDPSVSEWALLLREERPSPHRLPELTVEELAAPVATLLRLAAEPLSFERRASFAREMDATPDELESFIDSLVSDGVLVRG